MEGEMNTESKAVEYMDYDQRRARPHDGLTTVVDLTWDRRDRGGDWLIVERGSAYDGTRGDLWTATGRLIGTSRTERSARIIASRAARDARRHGSLTTIVTVVRRSEVRMSESSAPYGCLSSNV
jgi:hypothetical protein